MHILITGAAGMIGRKLTDAAGHRPGAQRQPPNRKTDIDRHCRAGATRGLFRSRENLGPRSRRAGRCGKSGRRAAGGDLPSCRRGIGRGGNRFREGLPRQSRRHPRAAGGNPRRRRRLQAETRVHLVDRGVRRAVSGSDRRRLPSHAAHLLRHAEGDLRTAARRLHATRLPGGRRHPAAVDRGAARQAEQSGVGLLFRHHPRAAGRAGGDPAGRRQRAALARQPALGGRISHPRRRPDARATWADRINLTMPGVCCTVGEQIARLAPHRRRQGRRAHQPRTGRTGRTHRRRLAEPLRCAPRASRSASKSRRRSTTSSAPISRTNWAARSRNSIGQRLCACATRRKPYIACP